MVMLPTVTVTGTVLLLLAAAASSSGRRPSAPAQQRRVFLWASADPFWLNLTMTQLHNESWQIDGRPIVDGVYAMCGTFWNTTDPLHPTIDINETSYEAVCGELERALKVLGVEMHLFLGGMVPAAVLANPASVAASATALARRHSWAGFNVDDEQECAPRANLTDFQEWASGMSALGARLSAASLALSADVQSLWGVQDVVHAWHAPCAKQAWEYPAEPRVHALLGSTAISKVVTMDTYGPGQGKSTAALGEFLDAVDWHASVLAPGKLVVGIQGNVPRANDTEAIQGRMRAIWDQHVTGMAFWMGVIGEEWRPWLYRWKTSCAKCPAGAESRACWTLEADCGERAIAASKTDDDDDYEDSGDSAVIASVAAPGVRLTFFANCSATATSTATNSSSLPGPVLLLFNRVADNQPQDWSVCISASALDKQTLRVVANHSYGSVDIRITAGARWLTFELLNLANWHADPEQTHLKFNNLCPRDMCGVVPTGDPSSPWPGGDPEGNYPYSHPVPGGVPGTRREIGTFTGIFGGGYASGFLTITSNWQLAADMWFAKQGWRLVYLIAPEADVPQLVDEVNAAEGIAKRSANRAYSWLWVQGLTSSENLNETIKLANALGVQVLLMSDLTGPGLNGYLTNVGDYTVNKKAWPNGLAEIRERAAPHGLKVGFHMLSSGTSVCMDQMQGPDPPGVTGWGGPWPSFPSRLGSCKGDIMLDTVVSRSRPELFVPQGLSPLHYMYAITAGSWPCHERGGKGCGDITRRLYPAGGGVVPLTPAQRARTCEVQKPACAPGNPLMLVNTSTGTASWSKLGRFRDGGAISFSGGGSHGRLQHTPEYDFRSNPAYFNISSEFTLHMTIHPIGLTTGRVQILASKAGEWSLQLSAQGKLQWRVHLASGWAQANGSRAVMNGSSYVIKATHAGNLDTCRGTLKLFSCELAPDSYACPLSVVEGCASGLLPLQTGTADIIWGAEQPVATVVAGTSFVGAMEELFLSRISLENTTAHLFLSNGYPMYIFDYTQPATRKYWADAVAAVYNEAGAVCGQWDGSEYQPGMAGWGLPHSSQTWSAGADALWWTSLGVAAEQSRKQWKEDVAVEFSISMYGDGPWRGDMEPFGDEGLIKGGRCAAAAGSWLIGMVSSMYTNEMALNAYDTGINVFFEDTSVNTAEAQVDCWFGGLIALGIGPQMTTDPVSAFKPPLSTILPRIKFWNELFVKYGHSMGRDTIGGGISGLGGVDTCTIYGCGTSFLLELSGGTQPGAHRGLYISNTSHLDLSRGQPAPLPLAVNTTLLLYLAPGLPFANLSLACLGETVTFVVCANASVFMTGEFWNLANQNVEETVLGSSGETVSKRQIFPGPQTGMMRHSFHQSAGDTVIYTKSQPLKSDEQDLRLHSLLLLKTDDAVKRREGVGDDLLRGQRCHRVLVRAWTV